MDNIVAWRHSWSFRSAIIIALLLLMSGIVMATEISLFNSDGEAVAYVVVDQERTIYLWDGTPVAYLVSRSTGTPFSVYGFNGNHLGWFDGSIMSDGDGYIVGFTKEAGLRATRIEPVKRLKKLTPLKRLKRLEPIERLRRSSFSATKLELHLSAGR